MIRVQSPALVAAMAAAMLFAAPANAEMQKFSADLSSAQAMPANDSKATGHVEVTLDTDAKTVTWNYSADGLSGPMTASHIHGPAAPGENAGQMVDTSAGMEGSAEVGDDVISALTEGKTYFNVHTEQYPDGEIRGQLAAAE